MIIDATTESLSILTGIPFIVGVAIGLAWELNPIKPSQPKQKNWPPRKRDSVQLPFADEHTTGDWRASKYGD